MKELSLNRSIYDKCNNSIIITGCARSGTTIMGKVIHSFKCVEYAFEPPILFSLFPLISNLDENNWKLLYETYLYEEFLIPALSGRAINCNRKDDSSIYKVKTEALINERLNKSLRKVDGERIAENSRIAYKMPDVVSFLPYLKQYYPNTSVIIMHRQAPYIFNSLLEKGWFNNNMLHHENVVWPNRFLNGLRIPFWVDPNDDDMWYEMDELHRIAYYYIRQHTEDIHDCIKIKYEKLIENPKSIAMSLAEKLGLQFGDKTAEILSTIRYTKKKRNLAILKKLEPEIRKKVEYYSNLKS